MMHEPQPSALSDHRNQRKLLGMIVQEPFSRLGGPEMSTLVAPAELRD